MWKKWKSWCEWSLGRKDKAEKSMPAFSFCTLSMTSMVQRRYAVVRPSAKRPVNHDSRFPDNSTDDKRTRCPFLRAFACNQRRGSDLEFSRMENISVFYGGSKGIHIFLKFVSFSVLRRRLGYFSLECVTGSKESRF